jgi:putative ABC transport system substrate-binding protein
MKRREFITALGGAAAWPLAARAQQTTMPVIGCGSIESSVPNIDGLRQGLKESNYLEGQNVTIEFRWAEGQYDRLPALAAELVGRQVTVIVGGGPPAAMAAKAATTTIPVVFTSGDDPVKIGLVSSLSRPVGNVTGVSILFSEVLAKRLGLLRELIPSVNAVGLLAHSRSSNDGVEAAARAMGLQLFTANVSTEDDLDAAFASLVADRIGAVLVGSDPAFFIWRGRVITLAARASLPAIYELRVCVPKTSSVLIT